MANAPKDNNQVPVMLGISNADGVTTKAVTVRASDHALMVDDMTTGSDLGPTNAKRDENGETTMMGVSSADGVTPVPIYVKSSNGSLLVNSN